MPPDQNANGHGEPEYSTAREDVRTNLDPELQRILVALRSGQSLDRTLREELTDGTITVDVVAKLRQPDVEVRGLTVVQKIGQIVTGMLEAGRIEEVRDDPNVISLKAARRLRRMLSNSVSEIHATRQQILAAFRAGFVPGTFGPVDGSGVIVGVVDRGCDFAHPHFRKPDGLTRILYLWDQRGGFTEDSPEGYCYGREFDEDDINNALLKRPATPSNPTAPHDFLGYPIGRNRSAHGTRVLDIAAGSGTEVTAPGVAPDADIIFVEASVGDELESDESFGNSRHLLEAVKYIFDKACQLKKRAVVNISLNYDCGPHDGTTPVEEGFDLLLEAPGRAIVIAAGNSRGLGKHARKTIRPRRASTIRWEIHSSDKTANKMEIWYTGKHTLELTLTSPRNQKLGPFPLDSAFTIYRRGERAGQVFHRRGDPSNNDNHIVLVFTTLMEVGVWELTLRSPGTKLFAPFDVHAWIETDDGVVSTFHEEDADDSYTVGAISCGHSVITVGSYDALDPSQLDSPSSEGPTRDGRLKPEVSAPGLHVTAASSLTASVGEDAGGTSNAAPHVTGLIALLMQDAPRALTIEETRALVLKFARRNPPPEQRAWDTRYGMGRVDAAASLVEEKATIQPLVTLIEHHEVVIEKEVTLIFEGEGVSAQPSVAGAVLTSLSVGVATLTASPMPAPDVSIDSAGAAVAVEDAPAAVEASQPSAPTLGH